MSAGPDGASIGRTIIVLISVALAAVVGWLLFFRLPTDLADLLGVLLLLAGVVVVGRLGSRIAAARFPTYDAAEVGVEGPITRETSPSGFPGGAVGADADEVVDQIERADEDPAAEALLLRLNTPGGQVVPSDDIRRAAARFDGPTVAYATDTCASGGYWIAAGCDELWARDASVVGSIGVIGSSVNVHELAEDLGVSYERFVAGAYKDAGSSLKQPTEADREYLQGIVDDYYDDFVERVAEGRDLDPQAVRDTEARVFLGEEAEQLDLVDEIGDRRAVEDRVADLLDVPEVTVEEFEPRRRIVTRLRGGAERVAFALGAGVASRLTGEASTDFRFRF